VRPAVRAVGSRHECKQGTLGEGRLHADRGDHAAERGGARSATERAEKLGLGNLSFQEGDASDLSELDDEQFGLVVSIFGATEDGTSIPATFLRVTVTKHR
jgi:hypothetical protein